MPVLPPDCTVKGTQTLLVTPIIACLRMYIVYSSQSHLPNHEHGGGRPANPMEDERNVVPARWVPSALCSLRSRITRRRVSRKVDWTVWSNLMAGPFTGLESIGLFLLGSSQWTIRPKDSSISFKEMSGASSPMFIPLGPAPLRAPPHVRRAAKTGEFQRAPLRIQKLESGKDNVCQESQSLSSVRTQIDKNSTTGTSDDHFDDDEINSEIKTPVPVPDLNLLLRS
ncbi:hypothetical protein EVAR_95549_1 [Eumeta japonica]|uniref:Uncharacterized protein n=1 Tax=Eumeta variegata TaxID=151549 RepID=A0A4C1SNK7_EUMVA|nr:hypothetical protein EVAR_95549_1 [Eumeta japonica]